MPSLPPRVVLETWKRTEIQKLCKDHGLKANLKTEALIDLLLDVNTPIPKPTLPSRTSSRSSSRTRTRTSSVVIHDVDPEGNPPETQEYDNVIEHIEPEPVILPPPATLPKGRKSKDLQTRLGKGRPVAVGGTGARAVTKSTSRPKRASRSIQQIESTIVEEPEPIEDAIGSHTVSDTPDDIHLPRPIAMEPNSDLSELPVTAPVNESHSQRSRANYISPEDLEMRIVEAVRPLQEQLKQMMVQLDQMQALKAEADQLQARVDSAEYLHKQVEEMALEMSGLRTQATAAAELTVEVNRLKDAVASLESRPVLPLTPQFTSTPHTAMAHLANPMPSGLHLSPASPGSALVKLGKRQRDSSETFAVETSETDRGLESSPEDPTPKISIPAKKRARLISGEDPSPKTPANHPLGQGLDGDVEDEMPRIPTPRHIARFRVYTDAEAGEVGAQPGNQLPTVDLPASPTQPRLLWGTSVENEHPFNFTFMPPPTPNFPIVPHSFPIPGPPASPTPTSGQPNPDLLTVTRARSGSRNVISGPFGPSHTRQRSRRIPSETAGLYVNPAALTRGASTSEGRAISGSEAAASLGLRQISGLSEESQAAQPIRGTMYGTELDGDRRFGDFGVEGVASGFWAGR